MSNDALEIRPQQPLAVNDILSQVRLIQEVMHAVMKEGEHFGKIPGCGDKPTLLQPGAQKLLMTFRLAPEYVVEQTDGNNGHREYRVQATLKTIGSGSFVGQGVGCCSTMEGKYRFRVAPKKLTDRSVPKVYWELRGKDPKAAQALLGGPGFSTKKDENGQWMITEGTSEKVEHDNPADYYNTVLKMAKKRALVDATITATAASDIFTQDIEDMPEVIPGAGKTADAPEKAEAPKASASSPKPPAAAPATGSAQSDGLLEGNGVLVVDYVKKEGKTAAGKPWVLHIGTFEHGGQKLEASTFDAKLGDALENLKGAEVDIKYQPGRKAGTMELVGIQPSDDVPF
jgi:hypothetical protein